MESRPSEARTGHPLPDPQTAKAKCKMSAAERTGISSLHNSTLLIVQDPSAGTDRHSADASYGEASNLSPCFGVHLDVRIGTVKTLLLVVAFMPALMLAIHSVNHNLGDDPIQAITYETGDWTMLLLAVTLAITPLRRMTGIYNLIAFRRMLGLMAFFYGSLHCATYLCLDKWLHGSAIMADIARRPFIFPGIFAFVLMIPLAVTSNAASIRRLGSKWKKLHQSIYVLSAAAVLHYVWMRSGEAKPYLYLLVFSVLLVSRLPWVNTRVKPPSAERTRFAR
jgi:methionine sulfoxide reductase heme-binding subunit